MTTWMDHETFVAQGVQDQQYEAPVPRPDEFPEDRSASLSFWIRDYDIEIDHIAASTPLPSQVDVVIIGSGITGASAVYEMSLRQPHLRIALLEARGVCTGATGRNGGHISRPECYHFEKTAKTWGADEAIRLKRFFIRNRDMMLHCIDNLNIAEKVDLRLNGTLVVFQTAVERDAFLADTAAAHSLGYEPENVFMTPEETANKFDLDPSHVVFGAAFLQKSGVIHPRKLVHALLQTAVDRMPGLSIHPHTPAVQVSLLADATSPSYEIRTSKGTITTRAIFHATNGYAGSICPGLHGKSGVFGCAAHMLAVQPNVKGSNAQLGIGFGYADFWHWLQQRPRQGPFLYGFAEAELLNRYDDTVTLPQDHPVRQKMKSFLETMFPAWFKDIDIAKDVTHDWTGVQGFTMTGASIVGKVSPESPGEFASVGHNGEGMSRCFASAVVATEALLAYLDGKSYQAPEWFPHTFRRNI